MQVESFVLKPQKFLPKILPNLLYSIFSTIFFPYSASIEFEKIGYRHDGECILSLRKEELGVSVFLNFFNNKNFFFFIFYEVNLTGRGLFK